MRVQRKHIHLTEEQKAECAKLKELFYEFNGKRKQISRVPQRAVAESAGISQGEFSRIMMGIRVVDIHVAMAVYELTGIHTKAYSTRLHEEMVRASNCLLGTRVLLPPSLIEPIKAFEGNPTKDTAENVAQAFLMVKKDLSDG